MTDPAIIAASYAAERNYSHNPDDVIDASDAVGAWGTTKESTTELVDLSGNGNIADIHGAMPAEGFIQGRRFDGDDDYLDCGNDSSLNLSSVCFLNCLFKPNTNSHLPLITKDDGSIRQYNLQIDTANQFRFRIWQSDGTQISLSHVTTISNKIYHVIGFANGNSIQMFIDGVQVETDINYDGTIKNTNENVQLGAHSIRYSDCVLYHAGIYNSPDPASFFNTLARLPFWSINYTDYPDNVAEYTDNLPYSSSIISPGTFKVDDDKLQCVSAGTMTYSASYEFDGSEYITATIGGVEYAGTGTITQGNTTVSVAQGSNKVTIEAGTGDTIDGIMVQFREEV